MARTNTTTGGGGGVTTFNGLAGAVTISAGGGIVFNPVGNDIEISAPGASPGAPLNAIQFNNPLGTFDGSANFTWTDATDTLNTFSGGNGTSLIDPATGRFAYGFYTGGGNGAYLDIVDGNNINFSMDSGRRFLVDLVAKTYTMGDIDTQDNGTTFIVDDTAQTYEFNKPNFNINTVPYVMPGPGYVVGGALTDVAGDGTLSWVAPAGGVNTLVPIDLLGISNVNGAIISGTQLSLNSATPSFGGVVNTVSQSFGGDKTFNGSVIAGATIQTRRGADVTAASALTLGTDGNVFHIVPSGIDINTISITGWQAGSQVVFIFDGVTKVTSNAGGGISDRTILLAGTISFDTVAQCVLGLVYDGTFWQETFRKYP